MFKKKIGKGSTLAVTNISCYEKINLQLFFNIPDYASTHFSYNFNENGFTMLYKMFYKM